LAVPPLAAFAVPPEPLLADAPPFAPAFALPPFGEPPFVAVDSSPPSR